MPGEHIKARIPQRNPKIGGEQNRKGKKKKEVQMRERRNQPDWIWRRRREFRSIVFIRLERKRRSPEASVNPSSMLFYRPS